MALRYVLDEHLRAPLWKTRRNQDMSMVDKNFLTETYTAIQEGNVEKVVSLIGGDRKRLEMSTPFGSWLHVAATAGKLDIVKRLIDLGTDLNQRGGTFQGSPLNLAASEGHLDVARYLLSCGAEMDVSEPERNPLFAAILGGHIEIAKLLVQEGIDTKIRYSGPSMKEMDALAFAQEHGQTEIARLLAAK